MKSSIQTLIALAIAGLLLGACQKKEEPATAEAPAMPAQEQSATPATPAPEPAPAEPGGWVPPADSAAPAAPAPEAAPAAPAEEAK